MFRYWLYIIVIFLSYFLGNLCAMGKNTGFQAAPLYHKSIFLEQPTGEKIKVYLKGNSTLYWYETIDGFSLLRNKDGYLVYARQDSNGKMVASDEIVQTSKNSSLLSLESSQIQLNNPVTLSPFQIESNKTDQAPFQNNNTQNLNRRGEQKVLLILVEFNNLSHAYPPSYFRNLMNQDGFNGTGSFRDYFLESSYKQLNLETTVTQWVKVSRDMEYYGSDHAITRELVREAIDSLDKRGFDFSTFDNDLNGVLDYLMVMHSGYGEELSGSREDILSHNWNLGQYTTNKDGVEINPYSIVPELKNPDKGSDPTEIGVICHEFAHFFGLLDLYDTDNFGSGGEAWTLGEWDLMAHGLYNNNYGASPADINAYYKYQLGWLKLTELTNSSEVILRNSTEYPEAYFFKSAEPNELFLLENKQNIGFNSSLPEHGMLIYHVDKDYSGWVIDRINADPNHQGLDIEEADNLETKGTGSGDPFPGAANITEFSDSTSPGSFSWSGIASQKPINRIQETNGEIVFNYVHRNVFEPSNLSLLAIDSSSVQVSLKSNKHIDTVLLAFSTDSLIDNPTQDVKYSPGDTLPGGNVVLYFGLDSTFSHTGLKIDSIYQYTSWSYDNGEYSVGRSEYIKTFDTTFIPEYYEDFSDSIKLKYWTVLDNTGNGQNWRFDNPKGRSITTQTDSNGYVIIDSDFYGKDGIQNSDLISPIFDCSKDTFYRIQFDQNYISFNENPSKASLYYSTTAGINWDLYDTWEGSSPNVYERNITKELAGHDSVRLKWNYTGANSWYWAVDDIRIFYQIPDSENNIIGFSFAQQTHAATIDTVAHLIQIEVERDVDLQTLIPEIEVSEFAKAHPSSLSMRDFSDTVTYTVTAENDSIQVWKVVVTKAKNQTNEIISFSLAEQVAPAEISNYRKTISIEVERGTKLDSLKPVIEISEGAEISPAPIIPQDFTNGFIYTITSEDSVPQQWTVYVTITVSSENSITDFYLPGQVKNPVIDPETHTVNAWIRQKVNLKSIVPLITISEFAAIQPNHGDTVDLSNPFNYIVTAENGESQSWRLLVKLDPDAPIKDISSEGINIFPNPSYGSITLDLKELHQELNQLSIYSSLGTLVYFQTISRKEFTIDLSNSKKGLYFLHLQGEDISIVEKLIIR